MIVFFSNYPIGEDLREGMAQRIKAIDTEFINEDRVYLKLSYKRKYSEFKISEKLTYIHANIFTNTKKICNILSKASHVYVHSILNGIYLPMFVNKCKKIILDLHGVVPEEQKLNGQLFRYLIFSLIEKFLFKRINYAVSVTNSMKYFYKSKYPDANKINYIVKPIYPKNSIFVKSKDQCKDMIQKFNIEDSDTVFIYSGGTQKWQNIELMIQCIESMNNEKYVFFILTPNQDEVNRKVDYLKNRGYRIFVDSVDPTELKSYYELAHYGFMLRDDIIVNRVASPTKMVEYLGYGITPIVKSPDIGDWNEMGYEYINFNDNLNNLSPRKCYKNAQIAKKNIEYSEIQDLHKVLFNG